MAAEEEYKNAEQQAKDAEADLVARGDTADSLQISLLSSEVVSFT